MGDGTDTNGWDQTVQQQQQQQKPLVNLYDRLPFCTLLSLHSIHVKRLIYLS